MKTKTTLPITEARKNIFSIAKKIQKGNNYYTLTKKGIPKAVILSAKKFEILSRRRREDFVLADGVNRGYSCHSQNVFAKNLIIRDDSRVVYLSDDNQSIKKQEESLIRAQLYVKLIENYKYPLELIEFGRYVKVGPQESKRYIEADIIINDKNGNVKMIFEVVPFSEYEENQDKIVADLFDLAKSLSWIKKPHWLIYFSRNSKRNPAEEKITTIDYSKFNSFLAWKKSGRPFAKKIPGFVE